MTLGQQLTQQEITNNILCQLLQRLPPPAKPALGDPVVAPLPQGGLWPWSPPLVVTPPHLPLFLGICVSFYLLEHLSPCWTASLPAELPLCLLDCLSACWTACLPVGAPLYLLDCPSACWTASLPIEVPICLQDRGMEKQQLPLGFLDQ